MSERILTVEDLRVDLPVPAGTLHAVQGVSFHVDRGETVCIVGKSGCGKTLTALAIMDLLPVRAQRTAKRLELAGRDMLNVSEREMSDIRGARAAMIFQEPMTSLNPAYTIGNQLEEALLRHNRVSRRQARERAVYLLERVGITAAGSRLKQYPHQLSGGLRQRVMIAMALMCAPAHDPRRRAHHGARRHHPGADPPPARRVAARIFHGARADHARPRRRRPHRHARRGDVRGRSGRDRHRRGDLLQPRPSLYARADRLHSRARPHAARPAPRHHPRHGALARRRTDRLPLRRPLQLRDRPLPPRAHSSRRGSRRRPPRALHPPCRDRRRRAVRRCRGRPHDRCDRASRPSRGAHAHARSARRVAHLSRVGRPVQSQSARCARSKT